MSNKANCIKKLVLVVLAVLICGPWALAAEKPAGEPGFVSIFNGKDLTGWDGDPRFWSVVDGFIRGRTTPDNPTKGNTFCVWRDGKPRNFILKTKFRLHNHNSGIQYRSKEVDKWVIAGYQADILRGGLHFFYFP